MNKLYLLDLRDIEGARILVVSEYVGKDFKIQKTLVDNNDFFDVADNNGYNGSIIISDENDSGYIFITDYTDETEIEYMNFYRSTIICKILPDLSPDVLHYTVGDYNGTDVKIDIDSWLKDNLNINLDNLLEV